MTMVILHPNSKNIKDVHTNLETNSSFGMISNIANLTAKHQLRRYTIRFPTKTFNTRVTHCCSWGQNQLRSTSIQSYKPTPLQTSQYSQYSTMAFAGEFSITKLNRDDFNEWAALFKGYINFYETSIPDEQYDRTFQRILDPKSDLHALVMRERQKGSQTDKMVAIAHFFPQQTPWSEQQIMLLNDLFVDPTLRGKGLGRKMIQAVADSSKEMGCLRLQWLTKHDNVQARRLYDTMAEASFVQYRMAL